MAPLTGSPQQVASDYEVGIAPLPPRVDSSEKAYSLTYGAAPMPMPRRPAARPVEQLGAPEGDGLEEGALLVRPGSGRLLVLAGKMPNASIQATVLLVRRSKQWTRSGLEIRPPLFETSSRVAASLSVVNGARLSGCCRK